MLTEIIIFNKTVILDRNGRNVNILVKCPFYVEEDSIEYYDIVGQTIDYMTKEGFILPRDCVAYQCQKMESEY